MRNMNASMKAEVDERQSQDRKMLEAVERIRTSLDRNVSTTPEQEHAQGPQHMLRAPYLSPAKARTSTESLVFVNHALTPHHAEPKAFKETNQMRKGDDGSLKDLQSHQEVPGSAAARNLIRRSPSEGSKATSPGLPIQTEQQASTTNGEENQTIFLMSTILTQRIKEIEQRMLVSETLSLCHCMAPPEENDSDARETHHGPQSRDHK